MVRTRAPKVLVLIHLLLEGHFAFLGTFLSPGQHGSGQQSAQTGHKWESGLEYSSPLWKLRCQP
jgi:hypothetical protein